MEVSECILYPKCSGKPTRWIKIISKMPTHFMGGGWKVEPSPRAALWACSGTTTPLIKGHFRFKVQVHQFLTLSDQCDMLWKDPWLASLNLWRRPAILETGLKAVLRQNRANFAPLPFPLPLRSQPLPYPSAVLKSSSPHVVKWSADTEFSSFHLNWYLLEIAEDVQPVAKVSHIRCFLNEEADNHYK